MTTPKRFKLNLDLPEEERWQEIIPLYKKEILKILTLIDELASQIPIIASFTKETLLWLIRRRVASGTVLYLGEAKSIAEMLDVPIGTVMSRLHRGRKSLQQTLWEFAEERGLVGGRDDGDSA